MIRRTVPQRPLLCSGADLLANVMYIFKVKNIFFFPAPSIQPITTFFDLNQMSSKKNHCISLLSNAIFFAMVMLVLVSHRISMTHTLLLLVVLLDFYQFLCGY